MLEYLKQYIYIGAGVIFLSLLATIFVIKYQLNSAQAKLATTQMAVERITDSMVAYKKLGDTQDATARKALQDSAAISQQGAATVLQTLGTTDDQASRDWALSRIKALEGK